MRIAIWSTVFLGAVLIGCGSGENLKELSSAEIQALLKGNIAEGKSVALSRTVTTYFNANGAFAEKSDEKRTGKWRVDDKNHLCVTWDTRNAPAKNRKETEGAPAGSGDRDNEERCFSVKQDVQGEYRLYNSAMKHVRTLERVIPGSSEKM